MFPVMCEYVSSVSHGRRSGTKGSRTGIPEFQSCVLLYRTYHELALCLLRADVPAVDECPEGGVV